MYQMPVKAIKNILGKELEAFYGDSWSSLKKDVYASVPFEMLSIARTILKEKLAACETYEELEDFVNFAGYRMSLEEWINSL